MTDHYNDKKEKTKKYIIPGNDREPLYERNTHDNTSWL